MWLFSPSVQTGQIFPQRLAGDSSMVWVSRLAEVLISQSPSYWRSCISLLLLFRLVPLNEAAHFTEGVPQTETSKVAQWVLESLLSFGGEALAQASSGMAANCFFHMWISLPSHQDHLAGVTWNLWATVFWNGSLASCLGLRSWTK